MRLNCQIVGYGPKPLLAFHGIGQDHRCFLPLVNVLEEQYTFYLFDLPFHGKSPAMDAEKLSMAEWKAIIDAFLVTHQIQTFSVAGFSMGGKFALATVQLFPERLEGCWLLAPDGITESPWYRLATRFWLSKKLFKFFVSNVGNLKKLAAPLVKLSLVEKSAVKFAQSTLSTESQRERVYRSWVGFSTIRPNMPTVATAILRHKIDLKLFLGKFDALLPASYVTPLTKRVPTLHPIILPTGHHRLLEKVAVWFAENGRRE